MQTFGEQLTQARSDKGMTQDALAKAVNVSRSTVSSWERNRTQPDIETLKSLSDLLGVTFDMGVHIQEPAEPEPETKTRPKDGKRLWFAVAGVAVVITAIVLAVTLFAHRPAPEAPKDTFDAAVYQQTTQRQDGKAYLVFNNVQWEESGENQTFTRYAFKMFEKNGVGFFIENIEIKAESANGNVRTANYGPDDLKVFNLKPDIEPMGSLNFEGGWPKGEFDRVGISVYGTDEGGEKEIFYSLIEW